jgi:hypothetical protein
MLAHLTCKNSSGNALESAENIHNRSKMLEGFGEVSNASTISEASCRILHGFAAAYELYELPSLSDCRTSSRF